MTFSSPSHTLSQRPSQAVQDMLERETGGEEGQGGCQQLKVHPPFSRLFRTELCVGSGSGALTSLPAPAGGAAAHGGTHLSVAERVNPDGHSGMHSWPWMTNVCGSGRCTLEQKSPLTQRQPSNL